jgi:hypothetical protein
MSEPIYRRYSLSKSLYGSRHPKHTDIPLQVDSKYKLSCKEIFTATDDTGFEEKGTSQYITKLYVKDKDRFYFEVNQEGRLYAVHCKRNGNIFNCKGPEKLKRRVP